MPRAIDWTPLEVQSRILLSESGCWQWRGPLQRDGYALIAHRGRQVTAHRFVYELLVAPIEDGLTLDHLCHNASRDCVGGAACLHRSCVNPDHLEPVTAAENSARAKARITHCPQGHEYAGWNLIRYRGRRYCRACTYARTAAARSAS